MTTALEKITIEGFQALIFRVQDILFAVDLEQIDELLEMHQLDAATDRPVRLDRLLSFSGSPVVYHDPRVLTINHGNTRLLLQIDQPEDIVFIRLETMRPFPQLLDRVRESEFVWGVGLVREEPVILLDCHKMAILQLRETALREPGFRHGETHAKT